MHRPPPQQLSPATRVYRPRVRGKGGFSLIEVTLAIGIIAFAFVALFGLLPTGMQTFRAAVDGTNDITMFQDMNAMVQVTSWKNLEKLDYRTGDIYYFDEEGRRTDTKKNPSTSPDVQARRLYQVKLLIEPAYEPGVISSNPDPKRSYKDSRRVIVVIGDYNKPKSKKDFEAVTQSSDLKQTDGKELEVRSRAFIVPRMESETGD